MRLYYLPNCITCLRFVLVVPILMAIFDQNYVAAFYLFFAAGISDALDGLLARLFGWTSRFGAAADPLADKILLMSSFIALGCVHQIPAWLVILVVVRDIWIMCGGVAYRFIIGPFDFKPSGISKINTFLQILLVLLLLIHLSFVVLPVVLFKAFMIAIALTSTVSLIHYTWVWGGKAYFNFQINAGSSKIYNKVPRSVI